MTEPIPGADAPAVTMQMHGEPSDNGYKIDRPGRQPSRKRRRPARRYRAFRRHPRPRRSVVEQLLHEICDGLTYLGRGRIGTFTEGVHALISIPTHRFEQLCQLGAALEDMEDGGDTEPDSDDEPSLGSLSAMANQLRWSDGTPASAWSADCEHDTADDEPSLGSVELAERPVVLEAPSGGPMILPIGDQSRWAWGGRNDLEHDRSDDEISAGIDEGEPDYLDAPRAPAGIGYEVRTAEPPVSNTHGLPVEYPCDNPVTGESGKWVMLPKEGKQ